MSSSDRFSHFVGLAIVVPIILGSMIVGDAGRGRAAAMAVAVLIIAARQTWELRHKMWYWILLCLLTAVHIVLIVYSSWSDRNLSYLGLLPFVAADYLIVYGIIWFLKKAMTLSERRKN